MSDRPVGSTQRWIEQVNQMKWVHRIDLGHGIVTPGDWPMPNPCFMQALDTIDFRGKKVLDIGCWDGLYSFEAEKRGAAEVYATDLVTQRRYNDHTTFTLAREILGSKARYFPDVSVYDVERLGVRDFDVVIYAGVYYHLKDPLRSFATLRRVMKEGGTMIVEGAAIDAPECYARFYYEETFCRDNSNWWVPTVPCLRQWVACNFFEISREFGWWDPGANPRYVLNATAVRRKDPLYLRPDPDLAEYDLNDYPTPRIPGRASRFVSRLLRRDRATESSA